MNHAMQFITPIPVITCDDKDGYAIYVRDGGSFENDVWCVVLCDGGHLRHYATSQLRMHQNMTFNIRREQ